MSTAYTTISSQNLRDDWPEDFGGSGTLAIFATDNFTSDDGKSWVAGTGQTLRGEFVTESAITVESGVATYASYSLPTTDTSTPANIRYFAVIFDEWGGRRVDLWSDRHLRSSLGTSITELQWSIDNQQRQFIQPDTHPTTNQMNAAIAAALYTPATTTRNGLVRVTANPDDAAIPYAVEENDPILLPGADIKMPQQYGAIADGSSHPLSTVYGTLAAAKAAYDGAYRFITSLGQEIDYAAIKACSNAALGPDLEPGSYTTIGVGSTTTVIQDSTTTFTSANVGQSLVFRYANDFIEHRLITAFTAHSLTLASALTYDWSGVICGYASLVPPQAHDCIAYAISPTVGENGYTDRRLNKPIYLSGDYYIGADTWTIRDAVGPRIYTAGKLATRIRGTGIVFQTDGLWDAHIDDFTCEKTGSAAGPVIDIDGNVPTHAYPTRSVQQNEFNNCMALGATATTSGTIGVAQCRQGGASAQGENLWINPQIASVYTCFYNNGFNALGNKIVRGDFQDYVRGIETIAGWVNPDGPTMESGHPYEQATQDGWDIVTGSAGVGERMVISGIRTESLQFYKGSATQPSLLQGCEQVFGSGFTAWSASGNYALHDVVTKACVADASRTHAYYVSTAGVAGLIEPVWPISGTIADNTVVWTELPFFSVDTTTITGGQSNETIVLDNCSFAGPVSIGGFSDSIVSTISANFTQKFGDWQKEDISYLTDATSGNVTYTIGNAPIGTFVRLKRIDSTSNTVTIAGGVSTIDAAASIPMLPLGSLTLVCTAANTWRILSKIGTSSTKDINCATGAAIGTSSTVYLTSGTNVYNSTEANRQVAMSKCAVRNLRVNLISTSPAAGAVSVTIRKNGADTAVTVSISAGTTAQVVTDLTHAVAFAANDLFSISLVNADAANSWNVSGMSISYELVMN